MNSKSLPERDDAEPKDKSAGEKPVQSHFFSHFQLVFNSFKNLKKQITHDAVGFF